MLMYRFCGIILTSSQNNTSEENESLEHVCMTASRYVLEWTSAIFQNLLITQLSDKHVLLCK